MKTIRAELDVPSVVEIPPGAEHVDVAVRGELANTGGSSPVVLHAPSGGHEAFWHVLDDNHREVQRGTAGPSASSSKDVEDFRSLTITPGHPFQRTEVLALDAKKLKPGRTYTIRAQFFGQVAEARFMTVAGAAGDADAPADARPAKKSRKKGAAKKKAGAKKAARKKTAAKKKAPAKKKTAAKKKAAKKKTAAKKKAAARARPPKAAGADKKPPKRRAKKSSPGGES